jgi:indole-3-glycerol phosphate synthase
LTGLVEQLVLSARERARGIAVLEPDGPPTGPSFEAVLRGKLCLDVIAEFKRKSPSLGAIAEPVLEEQVRRYEEAGAAAISVLTEPTRFGGSCEDLSRAVRTVDVPVLMKDFVVDPAQGERLPGSSLSRLSFLDALEATDELASPRPLPSDPASPVPPGLRDREALRHDAAVIGANNRDLETLEIDRGLAPRLLAEFPGDRVAVAESGYERVEDVRGLRGLADAVLVGGALMRHGNPAKLIR